MSETDTTERPVRPPIDEDDRVRHYVKRKTPTGKRFHKEALCGAKVRDIHVEHNGKICQKCVEILRERGKA